MDFASVESALYGDVEGDEDLLNELKLLEDDQKAKVSSSLISSETLKCAKVSRGLPENLYVLDQNAIAEVLKDIDEPLDNDEDIDDSELIAELSEVISGVAANQTNEELEVVLNETNIDSILLERLQKMHNDYMQMVAPLQNDGDSAKLRRYLRAVEKLKELIRRASTGKAIEENEIPVAVYVSQVDQQNVDEPSESVPSSLWAEIDQSQSDLRTVSSSVSSKSPLSTCRREVSATEIMQSGHTNQGEYCSVDEKVESSQRIRSADKTALESLSTQPFANTAKEELHFTTPQNLTIEEMLDLLRSRRRKYITAAQSANKVCDKGCAYEYYSVAKQFDKAIDAVVDGEITECSEVDIPPSPPPYKRMYEIPNAPKTVAEGLVQRLELFKSICEECKIADARKYRMNMRIVKQYEMAIQAYETGSAANLNHLPCPPGFPPLPILDGPSTQKSKLCVELTEEERPSPTSVGSFSGSQSRRIELLEERQSQLKQAALLAKREGNVTLAKKYLLSAKKLTPFIETFRSGGTINTGKTQLKAQIEMLTLDAKPALSSGNSLDTSSIIQGNRSDVLAMLEIDIIRQIRFCESGQSFSTKLRDVPRVKLFESMLSDAKRDLIQLQAIRKNGNPLPKFHYEVRDLPVYEFCLDVDEDHLELTIISVLDVKLPTGWQSSDSSIFVKYDFSFPHEAHQMGKTKVVYGSSSPEFSEKFNLKINRRSRQLQRIIKRNCLKFEVYQKGGFWRRDKILGIVDCKLIEFERKTEIHNSVTLMEGRKLAGGKIEFKVRIREPLSENQIGTAKRKWLVLEA